MTAHNEHIHSFLNWLLSFLWLSSGSIGLVSYDYHAFMSNILVTLSVISVILLIIINFKKAMIELKSWYNSIKSFFKPKKQ